MSTLQNYASYVLFNNFSAAKNFTNKFFNLYKETLISNPHNIKLFPLEVNIRKV